MPMPLSKRHSPAIIYTEIHRERRRGESNV
jgi:hypothetical protein